MRSGNVNRTRAADGASIVWVMENQYQLALLVDRLSMDTLDRLSTYSYPMTVGTPAWLMGVEMGLSTGKRLLMLT